MKVKRSYELIMKLNTEEYTFKSNTKLGELHNEHKHICDKSKNSANAVLPVEDLLPPQTGIAQN